MTIATVSVQYQQLVVSVSIAVSSIGVVLFEFSRDYSPPITLFRHPRRKVLCCNVGEIILCSSMMKLSCISVGSLLSLLVLLLVGLLIPIWWLIKMGPIPLWFAWIGERGMSMCRL